MADPLVVYEIRTFVVPRVDGLQLHVAVVLTDETPLHPGIAFPFT